MLKKNILFLIFWGFILHTTIAPKIYAQDIFQAAIEAYKGAEFEQAATLFASIDSPEANLMAGKSLYAMGSFQEALTFLEQAKKNTTPDIYYEATFTIALIQLNLRKFNLSFDLLHQIIEGSPDKSLQDKATSLFDDFNKFVLPHERVEIVKTSEHIEVKEALLTYGVKHSSLTESLFLIEHAIQLGLPSEFISTLRLHQSNSITTDPFAPIAPKGFTYNIGVLLPQQNRNEQVYTVSRELYFGLLMAVEDFNSNQEDLRVALHVAQADSGTTLEMMMRHLVEEKKVDVIFGPLFSQDATIIAELSNKYGIPVLAPLANAEELGGTSDWFFQLNPSFSVRGNRMAEVAFNKLGYRDLSILNDRNSSGAIEAHAFKERIEELGGEIIHHFEIDFRMRRFDVVEFTQHFAGNEGFLQDTTITLQHVDAVFMPLTGTASNTMIDIVLTDLQVFGSRISIIGTEDWGLHRINREAVERFNIVYSGIFDRTMETEAAKTFINEYYTRFEHTPELFALNGYDHGLFILNALQKAVHPFHLAHTFRVMDRFEGTAQHIHFKGTQVNQAVEPRLLTQTGHIIIK